MAKKKVEVYLEEEDIKYLDEKAKEQEKEGFKSSRSFLINKAVKEFIKRNE
jgi:metal-responsive CopG/Arc/MetJ family transcriptional regulator